MQLEISANASAILAKHNIQLNLGERSGSEQSRTDPDSSLSSLEDDIKDVLINEEKNGNSTDDSVEKPAVVEAWAPIGGCDGSDIPSDGNAENHFDSSLPVDQSDTSDQLSCYHTSCDNENRIDDNVKKSDPDFSIDRGCQ